MVGRLQGRATRVLHRRVPQATRVLNFPRHSLAWLLKHYCGVNANKQYQLADWRIRPLPEEMLQYAREDTHYLLYIYDRLRYPTLRPGPRTHPHSWASVWREGSRPGACSRGVLPLTMAERGVAPTACCVVQK